jgi:alpha-glucosidase
VFNWHDKSFPPTAKHIKSDGTVIDHLDVHNSYGVMMQWATYEALLHRDENRRPFLLTRSSWIGGQQYGAIWTGDNTGVYDELQAVVD